MLPNRMMANRTLLLLFALVVFVLFSGYLKLSAELDRLSKESDRLERLVGTGHEIDRSKQSRVLSNDVHINSDQVTDNSLDPLSEAVVIYNRVPKTGSTTFMGLAYDLCKENKFNVLHLNTSKNNHVLSLDDQYRFVSNVTTWKDKKPSLYHGHIAYIDFDKFGVKSKPIFINLVRLPLDRLVSYYYFLRYGDDFRPHVARKRKGNNMTFDDCITRGERDCDPNLLWLQIPFFCGHAFECWVPGNSWALAEAKRNLISNYLLVGTTEHLHDFVAVLEQTLPRFFKGATTLYEEGSKSHLRKTYNKVEPSVESVARIQQSKIWQMEQDFYDFALNQFNFLKKQTFLAGDDGSGLKPKGQQFFYEKIRPK